MLERAGAQGAVWEVLQRAHRSEGTALFILGEAGMGKTALLDFACSVAEESAKVGVGRGHPMETALPFGLVVQLIVDLGGRRVLDQQLTTSSPQEARASLFYRTLSWLEELTADVPVLLALDDLQWADGDSLELLSFICRRIGATRVAVVATLRPWPAQAQQLGLDLTNARHAQIVHLQPLSEKGAGAFLGERLNRSLPPSVVRAAHASSGGNPLLLELLAVALDQGEFTVETVATGLETNRLLLRRFTDLPDEALVGAHAACVLGTRFQPDVAIAVARLHEEQAEAAFEVLSRTGLVRAVQNGRAEFTHPLLRQALYDDLPPLLRLELHTRAFAALMERGMDLDAAEHAVHGHMTGNAQAVRVLLLAGRAALRAGAVATAVERLEAAVVFAGDRADDELLILLGDSLLAAGHGEKAIAVYKRLLDLPGISPSISADALRMLGRALLSVGQSVEAIRRFEEAESTAGSDHPVPAVQATLDLSRAAWLTAGPAGALVATLRARAMAPSANEDLVRQAEAAWRFVGFASGDPDALADTTPEELKSADDNSVMRDLAWNWGTLRNSGRAAKYAERFSDAEAVFTRLFAAAERAGSPHALASLAAHHADTLARQGRFQAAMALADRATRLVELAPMSAAFAHVARAWLLLHEGRLEESEVCCRLAEAAASPSGQWLPLLRVWHVQALRHFHEGALDEACDLYMRLEEESARLGIGEPCLVPWARYAISAHLARGQYDVAQRVLSWVEECASRLPCRWPQIALHVGRSSLAEARDDDAAADVALSAALQLHEGVDLPVEHIETLLQHGGFLRRTGRVQEARIVLRRALGLAEEIGATWLGGYVHGELAVAGGRRRVSRSPLDLTAQEQRVADLAAAGRSNREIAQLLSVSGRTVESHLTRVYAKLGVHSKRELMTRTDLTPERP